MCDSTINSRDPKFAIGISVSVGVALGAFRIVTGILLCCYYCADLLRRPLIHLAGLLIGQRY